MNNQKPLKLGMKYGAMKLNKGGCMSCGNMEHTGCVCHMLGAGKKQKKKGGELPQYMENIMRAYENQDNKPDKYTGYTMEELALMPATERRRIKREAETKRYNTDLQEATKEAMKRIRGGVLDKNKSNLLRSKFQSLNRQHEEMKKAQEEADRKAQEEADRKAREAEKGDWLDDIFDFATDKLIDYGSKAIGSVIPGTEGIAKTGLKALQKGLKGMGEPRQLSQKQKEYQQALQLIKKKYNLNHKQAMVKYANIKNQLK
jgi:hypothetical protein